MIARQFTDEFYENEIEMERNENEEDEIFENNFIMEQTNWLKFLIRNVLYV